MTKPKKRNKQYKPKAVVLPLGIRPALKFELPGFVAAEALGTDWFSEAHVYSILSNADLVRRIAPDGHPILAVALRMVGAIAEIQHRAQRTGRHGVTGDEMVLLREGVAETTKYLRSVSNYAVAKAAKDAVDEFDRNGCLRV